MSTSNEQSSVRFWSKIVSWNELIFVYGKQNLSPLLPIDSESSYLFDLENQFTNFMTTSSPDLKSIKIVYGALLSGVIFFLVISVVLIYQIDGPFVAKDQFMEQALILVSSLFAVVSVSSGIYIFRKRMSAVETLSLKEKIATYQSAMIIRAATMEGSVFFFIICFLLQGSMITFVEVLSIIALMIYFFPTTIKVSDEIKHDLRKRERQ